MTKSGVPSLQQANSFAGSISVSTLHAFSSSPQATSMPITLDALRRYAVARSLFTPTPLALALALADELARLRTRSWFTGELNGTQGCVAGRAGAGGDHFGLESLNCFQDKGDGWVRGVFSSISQSARSATS